MRIVDQRFLVGLLLLLGGCTGQNVAEIQAPFDSYVCFDTSFIECLRTPQLANANKFKDQVYKAYFVAGSAVVHDPRSSVVNKSKDGKYQCSYGRIPYTQTLRETNPASVVFVAPGALNQVGEQMVRLDRIRMACSRAIETYNLQVDLLTMQDGQSNAQKAVQYLTTKIENENIGPDGSVNTTLSNDEISTFGLTPPPPGGSLKVADQLLLQRNQNTLLSDQIRTRTKTQTMSIDYKHQFEDAQLAIDAQLREVANELLAIDSSAVSASAETGKRFYENGNWVQKGTIVVSLKGVR